MLQKIFPDNQTEFRLQQVHLGSDYNKHFFCLSFFYRVPTFPDWQNSMTFPVFFPIFQYFFLVFCFLYCFTENLIHFNKQYTVHLNITKNNI